MCLSAVRDKGKLTLHLTIKFQSAILIEKIAKISAQIHNIIQFKKNGFLRVTP